MCEFMTPGVRFAQRMSPESAALKRTPPQSEGSVQCQCDDTLEKVALGTPHTPLLSLLILEWVKYSETSSKKACPTASMDPQFSVITTSWTSRTRSYTNISTKISCGAFLNHGEIALPS